MNLHSITFTGAYGELKRWMISEGQRVKTETWQGRDTTGRPDLETVELRHVNLELELRAITQVSHWREEIKPNLPWADEHFLERVSGEPLNPPPSWVRWPWAGSAANFRAGEQFNHTYPERYWPKWANLDRRQQGYTDQVHDGIRGPYGDLDDLVDLLAKQPLTRQAYIPIFFPEDTGTGDGGRKPCTLGYQFLIRGNRLDCFYPMRSCDLVRHFPDDVYLTVRLMLWVIERLRHKNLPWADLLVPGQLIMHMTSLHCFINDMIALKKEQP